MSFLLNCPNCGIQLKAQDDWNGLQIRCPHCKNIFKLTKPGANVNSTPAAVLPPTPSAPGYGQGIERFDRMYFEALKKRFFIWLMIAIPTCGLGLIGASVYMLILLYRCWQIALYRANQRGVELHPGITPGTAVGFLFIPFFALYWIYVAYVKLEQSFDMLQGRKSTPFGLMLAVSYWVNAVAGFISYLGILAASACIVFMILWFYEYEKRVIELVENQSY